MSEQDPGRGPEPDQGEYGRASAGERGHAAPPDDDPSSTAGYAGDEGGGPPEESRSGRTARERPANMLPGRNRRRFGLERALVRLVATGGVIGIGVAIAAILGSSNVQAWIIGLVVATLSVLLSAILWSSRQL